VQEEVACLSSSRELGLSLPDALKLQDLQALPVRSLDEVVGAFKALDRAGIRESRLSINIVPSGVSYVPYPFYPFRYGRP